MMTAQRKFGDSVIRHVATYVNGDGQRTLMNAAQGRYTFDTEANAQAWIDAVTSNNHADTLKEAWGTNPRFAVRECPCWPGHFDPQTVWFDTKPAPWPEDHPCLSSSDLETLVGWLRSECDPKTVIGGSYTVGQLADHLDTLLDGMWPDGIDARGEDR